MPRWPRRRRRNSACARMSWGTSPGDLVAQLLEVVDADPDARRLELGRRRQVRPVTPVAGREPGVEALEQLLRLLGAEGAEFGQHVVRDADVHDLALEPRR